MTLNDLRILVLSHFITFIDKVEHGRPTIQAYGEFPVEAALTTILTLFPWEAHTWRSNLPPAQLDIPQIVILRRSQHSFPDHLALYPHKLYLIDSAGAAEGALLVQKGKPSVYCSGGLLLF